MKYRVIVNSINMLDSGSALQAMNMVMNCLKGKTKGESYIIEVFYTAKDGWRLENKTTVD